MSDLSLKNIKVKLNFDEVNENEIYKLFFGKGFNFDSFTYKYRGLSESIIYNPYTNKPEKTQFSVKGWPNSNPYTMDEFREAKVEKDTLSVSVPQGATHIELCISCNFPKINCKDYILLVKIKDSNTIARLGYEPLIMYGSYILWEKAREVYGIDETLKVGYANSEERAFYSSNKDKIYICNEHTSNYRTNYYCDIDTIGHEIGHKISYTLTTSSNYSKAFNTLYNSILPWKWEYWNYTKGKYSAIPEKQRKSISFVEMPAEFNNNVSSYFYKKVEDKYKVDSLLTNTYFRLFGADDYFNNLIRNKNGTYIKVDNEKIRKAIFYINYMGSSTSLGYFSLSSFKELGKEPLLKMVEAWLSGKKTQLEIMKIMTESSNYDEMIEKINKL